MSATRHHAPAADVRVSARREGARRTQDLGRKLAIARRHVDRCALGDGPRAVHPGVIRPERRADRAGEPIEADIGQQLVLREHRSDVAAAIGPGAELLDDPGGQAGRRVRQAEGEGLRPRALDPLVARSPPSARWRVRPGKRRSPRALGRRASGVAPHREQVEVDADQLVGMGEPSRDAMNPPQSPPCAPKRRIAQHVRHQFGEAIGHRLDTESPLAGLEREAEAGQRRRDDGEGVGRVAAEAGRVGEARDELQELEHRAGPAVRQQQRARGPAPGRSRAGSAGRCRAAAPCIAGRR